MKELFSENKIVKTTILIICIIIVLLLFVLRVGVEDNGSLSYTLGKLGLYDANSASGSGYYSPIFGVDNYNFDYSSGNLLYMIIKAIFMLFSINVIPVYFPALIYSVIFIMGLYFLFKKIKVAYNWNNVLTLVAFLFIFCDISYISYFNTPSTYAPIISFTPLFVYSIILLTEKKSYLSLLLQTVISFLLFNTHIVLSVVGILYGIYFIRFIFLKKSVLWKAISILCALLIILSNITFCASYDNDKDLYNSCFYGALLNRTNPALIDLPQEYAEFIAKPAFEDEAQKLINSEKFIDFKNNVGYSSIASYYLKNPSDLFSNLKTVANNTSVIKIGYLGNFAVGSSHSPKAVSNIWGLYNMLRRALFPASLIAILILTVVAVYVSFNFRKNYSQTETSKICCELIAFVAISAIVALLVTLIIFGLSEISYNLFVYNFLTDVCIAFSLIAGSRMLFIKRKILATKYGVNQ